MQVSDFGLSRIHIGEKTVATQTYGTVTHMPPELLSEGRLSKAADVCEPLCHLPMLLAFNLPMTSGSGEAGGRSVVWQSQALSSLDCKSARKELGDSAEKDAEIIWLQMRLEFCCGRC